MHRQTIFALPDPAPVVADPMLALPDPAPPVAEPMLRHIGSLGALHLSVAGGVGAVVMLSVGLSAKAAELDIRAKATAAKIEARLIGSSFLVIRSITDTPLS